MEARPFLATPTRQRTVSTSTVVVNDATPLLSGQGPARPLPSRPTARLIFAACIAAAGSSFQFGYHVGDYGAAAIDINKLPASHKSFQSTYMQYLCELGGFLLGGLIGALCGGALANRLGRKGTLLLNDFVFVAGATCMAFAKYFFLWILGRFIVGLGSGIGTIVVPVYCAEISPRNLRGALTTAHQLFVALGVLVAALLSMNVVLGSEARWPLLLGVSASLATAHFFLFLFCPESPRYLYSRGVEVSTVDSLQRLRGSNNVDAELKEMHLELESERGLQNMSYWELLMTKCLRAPLLIGVVLHMGQQMSGMNALIIYSADVFASSSLQAPDTDLAIIGGVNFGVTLLLSIWLLDRVGRRPLLMWSYVAMTVMYIILALSSLGGFAKHSQYRVLGLLTVIGIVVAYAVGPGPVTWIMPTEMFPLSVRTQMLSICVCVNWVFQAVCLSSFLVLKSIIGPYTMYVFALLCAGFALFTCKFVPETANSTANETMALFGPGPPAPAPADYDKHEPLPSPIPALRTIISPTASYQGQGAL